MNNDNNSAKRDASLLESNGHHYNINHLNTTKRTRVVTQQCEHTDPMRATSPLLSTYTAGFKIKQTQGPFRASDLARLCLRLTHVFENHPRFEPERIFEGGIVWKGQEILGGPRAYKSMRIYFASGHKGVCRFGKWSERWQRHTTPTCPCSTNCYPYILTDDSVEEFASKSEQKDQDSLLMAPGCETSTYLKAFNGAPVWTLEELKRFKAVFEEFGFEVHKLPQAKLLTTTDCVH